MLNKISDKYHRLVLNTKPSKTWKTIRFFIHWATLPIKLAFIGTLGIYQIIAKSFTKNRQVPTSYPVEIQRASFREVMSNLPVLQAEESNLYTTRVPFTQLPNGSNHVTDHQCARHGTYVFLKRKLGLDVSKEETALAMHMQGPWLVRGFKKNPADEIMYNIASVSGDMLCGLNMGMLESDNEELRDKYYELIHAIIDNDYSLLAHDVPEADEAGYEYYMEKYKAVFRQPNLVDLKSYKGRWEPGLDVVGAQAVTVLAALRIGDKIARSTDAKKHYNKLLWKYGYGLLSLFPTTYIDSKRGYFNDNNVMASLYVLSKLSDSKLGKLFWKFAMVYTWALSKHWYNSYFTGLLNDAHPGTVSEKYVTRCQAYLFEARPRVHAFDTGAPQAITNVVPVPFNLQAEDEFAPDMAQNLTTVDGFKVRAGLGFMAHAVMIVKDPKELI